MPFLLVITGLIMIISALQNTHAQLGSQLRKDFVPFGSWVLALGAVGALGYVPELRRFSHYFMALIIVAMLLSNKGFFAKLTEAVKLGPVSPPGTAPASAPPTTHPATPTQPATATPSTSKFDSRSFGGDPSGPGYLNNPELQSRFNALMNTVGRMFHFWQ